MLDLKSFVINDELVIDKPHWHRLNNSHTQEEIKEAISKVIQDLPLPLENITKDCGIKKELLWHNNMTDLI